MGTYATDILMSPACSFLNAAQATFITPTGQEGQPCSGREGGDGDFQHSRSGGRRVICLRRPCSSVVMGPLQGVISAAYGAGLQGPHFDGVIRMCKCRADILRLG